jgi:uncharacterized protein (TIGR02058 family)
MNSIKRPQRKTLFTKGSENMEQVLFVQAGTGIDVHGQNITKAAVRAAENAIWYNSMPGIEKVLPDGNTENMKVTVKLAVPLDRDKLDAEKVKEAIPYGDVTVKVTDGGMATSSGVILSEKEDKNDLMYMVNASVEVGY